VIFDLLEVHVIVFTSKTSNTKNEKFLVFSVLAVHAIQGAVFTCIMI
jgi:hypothetical protein